MINISREEFYNLYKQAKINKHKKKKESERAYEEYKHDRCVKQRKRKR